ncbi:unnamed protein product, partial [Phaeothamnion confervicola]
AEVRENAALKLQATWRRVRRIAYPAVRRGTVAFSFEMPDGLAAADAEAAAWALLRRRSTKVRVLTDINQDTWFEHQDRVTGLQFYEWSAENDHSNGGGTGGVGCTGSGVGFCWQCPPLPPPVTEEVRERMALVVGERVLYDFG